MSTVQVQSIKGSAWQASHPLTRALISSVATLAILLAGSSFAFAQAEDVIPPAPVPRLPLVARNAAGFAPPHWQVQVQASGDLNGDGRPDLAFVLHETSTKLHLHNKGMGVEDLDTNPRMLCIAFAQADGTYRLAEQNATLIPRWTEANMDDYFGEEGSLTIARGAFTVGLHYFSNAGGWDAGSTSFTFRWQHGRFELIGYDNDNTNRATLQETHTSINFSTRRKVVSVDGPDDADPPIRKQTRQTMLPSKPLMSLQQVGNGFEFQEP